MQSTHSAARLRLATTSAALASLAALAACPSCGGGGGGGPGSENLPTVVDETEPNGSAATADAFSLGRPARGSVAIAGDVDVWAIPLTAGQVIRIELFGARFDQATWDAAGNVPRLTLIATDGVSKLLEHDQGGFTSGGWFLGAHDLDIPAFRVPTTGTYYVGVTQDDTSIAGGAYAIVVSAFLVPAPQLEAEPEGATGANDSSLTAQRIGPGTLRGFHVDGEQDWYEFSVPGPSLVTFEATAYRNGVFGGDGDYFDTALDLVDTDGATLLAANDDVFFFDSAIRYRLSAAGTYFLTVEQIFGTGDGRYFLAFTSTPLGSGAESEPNESSIDADPIAYGSFVTGAMDAGGVDFFSFAGTVGDMVRLELFDIDNQDDALDHVFVDFIDIDGTSLLSSDGFVDLQFVNTILPATGLYYVRVRPDPTPVPTSYGLSLARFKTAGIESEPNGTRLTADLLDADGRAAGVVDATGDVDTFKFLGYADRLITIVIYADDVFTGSDGHADFSGHGSDLDPTLTIKDGAGTVLATSTCNAAYAYTESVVDGLPAVQVTFVAPATDTYYVEVADAFLSGSAVNTYVIEKR